MGNVIELGGKRVFTLEEAREVFPIVRRLTKTAFDRVMSLTTQLSYAHGENDGVQLETEIRETFQDWQAKIQKLGGEAKGLWLVDFDSGDGYYCWHYPEPEIGYYHGYLEGFQGRMKLDEESRDSRRGLEKELPGR